MLGARCLAFPCAHPGEQVAYEQVFEREFNCNRVGARAAEEELTWTWT
jgi:hypothetical protein